MARQRFSRDGSAFRKNAILFISLSIAAFGGAFALFNSNPAPIVLPRVVMPVPKHDTDEVLVAALDVPMGTQIGDASVVWQIWPVAGISDEMITKSRDPKVLSNIKGLMTRAAFLRGEPIRLDKLVQGGPGGFMAAILPGGMRAVAIKIDTAGDAEAGGFILPNDRVDVLRIYRDEEATKVRGKEVLNVQTILANVRVLAIGQAVEPDSHKEAVTGGNATLELDPTQAELVILAQQMGGGLTLVLRSLADSGGGVETVDLERASSDDITIMRFGVAQHAAR